MQIAGVFSAGVSPAFFGLSLGGRPAGWRLVRMRRTTFCPPKKALLFSSLLFSFLEAFFAQGRREAADRKRRTKEKRGKEEAKKEGEEKDRGGLSLESSSLS